jgi:L-ascorbate metabolism protein UlaG (beta-lactamase superfamily)
MEIKWLGQSCFQIKNKEAALIIDPYSEKIGLKMPKVKPDVVLITHHHPDHDDLSRIEDHALIFDTPGEFEAKGFFIKGISTFHDKEQGAKRGKNTMFTIKTEGMTILHCGDLGHLLEPTMLEDLDDIDVLLIPVGGTYTIDGKEAAKITQEIEPRIVVPMHYKIPGLNLDLDGSATFIKEMGLTPEKQAKISISSRTQLPEEETRLVQLEPNGG